MTSQTIDLGLDSQTGTGRLSETSWDQAFEVPDEVRQRMPDPAMAVPLLLERPLPTLHTDSTPLPAAITCVIDSAPDWIIDTLLTSAVPPTTWRMNVEVEVRNRWSARTSVESIQHPTNTTQLLPLWALRFWTMMEQAIVEQKRWKKALEWVLKQEECSQRVASIALLGRIPWGLRLGDINVSNPDAFVGEVSDLLSFNWVRETHLDCFAVVLNSTKSPEWWATGTTLPDFLIRNPKRTEAEFSTEPILVQVRKDMAVCRASHLLMPVHVDNNHWIVVHVDTRQGTLAWGACLVSIAQHHSYPLETL
jgi:hypothetical protein